MRGLVFSDAGGTVESCEIQDVTDDGIIVRLGADPTIRSTTVRCCGYRGGYGPMERNRHFGNAREARKLSEGTVGTAAGAGQNAQ